MGTKHTALLVTFVVAILLTVQMAAVAGASQDEKGPQLEKRVYLLYMVSPAKPDNPGGGNGGGHGGGGGGSSGSYKFLSKGMKWKSLPIEINIQDSMDTSFKSAIRAGATEWDSHTSTDLFADGYTSDDSASWDGSAPDGKNEMVFGDYPTDGVIAVTVTWGYYSGPLPSREIIEFDIMFDTDFAWGDASVKGTAVMDMQDIATHEIGHGLGLADLYDSSDYQETMYGYASYGEMIKRDLYLGDVSGIQALYGE